MSEKKKMAKLSATQVVVDELSEGLDRANRRIPKRYRTASLAIDGIMFVLATMTNGRAQHLWPDVLARLAVEALRAEGGASHGRPH